MALNKSREIFFFSIAALVVFLDQAIKYLFLKFQPVLNLKLFSLHLVKNTGAAFGLLKEQTWLLTIISTVVIILIVYFYPSLPKEKFPQLFAALFLGGTLGNLIDRLVRKVVIDFVDFSFWPAFNLADACITIGAVGLIFYFWKK